MLPFDEGNLSSKPLPSITKAALPISTNNDDKRRLPIRNCYNINRRLKSLLQLRNLPALVGIQKRRVIISEISSYSERLALQKEVIWVEASLVLQYLFAKQPLGEGRLAATSQSVFILHGRVTA